MLFWIYISVAVILKNEGELKTRKLLRPARPTRPEPVKPVYCLLRSVLGYRI